MPEMSVRSRLHVEGVDDRHSIIHLLSRNGIGYHPDKFELSPPELPELKSVEQLIDGICTAVMASTGRAIGFLLDADSPLVDRWRSVSDRLKSVGVPNLPDLPPAEGFRGESATYKTRVGVWLMPDNLRDGKLEDFLRARVD